MEQKRWFFMAFRTREIYVACFSCAKGLSTEVGTIRREERTELPCTMPTQLCATPHLNNECDHDHDQNGSDEETVQRRDFLPRSEWRAIYDHFGDSKGFKTLDVTRQFGRYGAQAMRALREQGYVRYRLCGYHYIHRFK